jgi:hypothetical protein
MSTKNKRSPRDAYWTPAHLTHALLDSVSISGKIWEPCAGAGWMTDVLKERGLHVVSSDIEPQRDDITQMDFLDSIANIDSLEFANVDWIITNPPFKIAADILEKSLSITPCVAMLVRLTFLEGTKKRIDLFRKHPPSKIVMLPRTKFPRGDGFKQKGTDSVTNCWLVWGGDPEFPSWPNVTPKK